MRNTLELLRSKRLWDDESPLRLHLGCGEQHFEGYVNIDYPSDQHAVMTVRPDLEANLTMLSFPGESVDEIRLHHVFEHFSRVVALGLLIRWQVWLKPGGILVIETPDFIGTAKAALYSTDAARAGYLRHLEGDQAMPRAYHVGQWHAERFERTLAALGFVNVIIETSTTEQRHRVSLVNVTARAQKDADFPITRLVPAAERILWESTVADAEKPTWDVWCRQLRDFVRSVGQGPQRQSTLHTRSGQFR